MILGLLLLSSSSAHGQIVAQAGFNDVTGINGDGIANNLPYNINNAPLAGSGTGEPGWFSNWNVSLGNVTVASSGQFEGDGAAQFQGSTSAAQRSLSAALTGVRSVELRMKIQNAGSMNLYLRQTGTPPILGPVGPNWQASSDGRFRVVNGNEGGSGALTDTPFTWLPGVYFTVRVDVFTSIRRWDFYVDGVRFNSAPLGYRDAPVFLDQIDFLVGTGASPNSLFIDGITISQIPEPSSLAMCGLGLGSLISRVHRRLRRPSV